MKKLALILAIMLIPCTAFGLDMLDDAAMGEITAQDGVSIVADDIQFFINIDAIAWVDCDGFGPKLNYKCTGSGALVAIQNFQIDTLLINAVAGTSGTGVDGQTCLSSSNCSQIDLQYAYCDSTPVQGCIEWLSSAGTAGLDNLVTGTWGKFIPQALSIDVTDRLPVTSDAYNYIWASNMGGSLKVAGVIITLPTLEIYINQMMLDISIWDLNSTSTAGSLVGGGTETGWVVNNGDRYGLIYMDGITFTVLSGWVEIAPHHSDWAGPSATGTAPF